MRDASRFAIFLAVFSTVLGLASWYMARRLSHGIPRGSVPWWAIRAAFVAFVALQWVAPMLYQTASDVTVLPLVGLQWFSYLLLGTSAVLFFALLVFDIVALTHNQVSGERRLWMGDAVRLGILGATGSVVGAGALQARRTPSLKQVEVPIPGLAQDLVGLTIAQISDLHVGQTIQREYVERVVAACNAAKPDLVALTGDLVDGRVEQLRTQVEPLRGLTSKFGTFYVPGNHEYFWGGSDWLREFATMGFNVLGNAHQMVSVGSAELLVSGVVDFMAASIEKGARLDADAAVRGAPEKRDFHLMLAHQPKAVYACEKVKPDLQLSGHTHAGQFFPFAFFARLAHPYVKGLNSHPAPHGPMWVYVNQGTGYWGPPNRFGVPSEITLLRLVRA